MLLKINKYIYRIHLINDKYSSLFLNIYHEILFMFLFGGIFYYYWPFLFTQMFINRIRDTIIKKISTEKIKSINSTKLLCYIYK